MDQNIVEAVRKLRKDRRAALDIIIAAEWPRKGLAMELVRALYLYYDGKMAELLDDNIGE